MVDVRSSDIDRALQYESDFYNRLFLEKTVKYSDIKILIANSFAEYISIQARYKYLKLNSSGFFSSIDSTVVIYKSEKLRENSFLQICSHELSHAFLHFHVGDNYIPAWIIEGLAIYHEQMTYDNKKITHRVNSYYLGRVKTLIQLKEINLTEFVNWDYQKFSKESFTQEGYGYAIGYCMVLFLMQQDENELFEIFRNHVNEQSTIEVFDKYYTGGFSKFEKDFLEHFRK